MKRRTLVRIILSLLVVGLLGFGLTGIKRVQNYKNEWVPLNGIASFFVCHSIINETQTSNCSTVNGHSLMTQTDTIYYLDGNYSVCKKVFIIQYEWEQVQDGTKLIWMNPF